MNWWRATTWAGWLALIVLFLTAFGGFMSAIQQAAMAAMVTAAVVIPYCLARAADAKRAAEDSPGR